MNFTKLFGLVILLLGLGYASNAQVYLQLETSYKLKTIKFSPGDIIEFRTVAYPDTWRSGALGQVLFEAQTIFLDGNLFQLDEIKDIRLTGSKGLIRDLGNKLMQVGVSALFIGSIVELFNLTEDVLTPTNLIISGSAIGIGAILRFTYKGKKYKLGKRHRLRLIDHRFKLDDQLPVIP